MQCEQKGLHLQNDSQACNILSSHRRISIFKHLELYVAILYLLSLRKNVAAKSGNQQVRLRQRGKLLRKKTRVFGRSWYLQNVKNL